MKAVFFNPDEIYTITFRVLYRARRPPKLMPMWIANTNPTIRAVTRTGRGSEIEALLDPSSLDKIKASAEKKYAGKHLLTLSLVLGEPHQNRAPTLAHWDTWGKVWQVADVKPGFTANLSSKRITKSRRTSRKLSENPISKASLGREVREAHQRGAISADERGQLIREIQQAKTAQQAARIVRDHQRERS